MLEHRKGRKSWKLFSAHRQFLRHELSYKRVLPPYIGYSGNLVSDLYKPIPEAPPHLAEGNQDGAALSRGFARCLRARAAAEDEDEEMMMR